MAEVPKPTLVLVPGLDGTGRLFWRQIPGLERSFRTVVVPYPDAPAAGLDDLVAHLGRRIEESAPGQRVFLLGESMGGAIALRFALAFPSRLRGVVVVNSFARVRRRVGLEAAILLLGLLPWSLARTLRGAVIRLLLVGELPAAERRELEARVRDVDGPCYRRRLQLLRDHDLCGQLEAMRVPVLILAADHDRLLPSLREGGYLAACIPDATLRVLPGLGHSCLSHPSLDLEEEIASWLRSAALLEATR